jgi:hypothetical protein
LCHAAAQRRRADPHRADGARHQQIDTTLGYARLYDGTVAADYYGAMAQVERDLHLEDLLVPVTLGSGHLLALLDSLASGTLNESQRATVQTLRAAILARAEQEGQPDAFAMPLVAVAHDEVGLTDR